MNSARNTLLSVSALTVCSLITLAVSADLATTAWPMQHHDVLQSGVTDLNLDGVPGPDGPNNRSGVTVHEKWSKSGYGPCIANVSVGTDGALYYAAGTDGAGTFRKLNKDSGATQCSYTIGQTLVAQPLIVREGGVDKIFVTSLGKLWKFNTGCGLESGFPKNVRNALNQDIMPAVYAYDNEAEVLLFAAQGGSAGSGATLLMAYGADGTLLSTFDVDAYFINLSPTDDIDVPEDISINNTSAIGPHPTDGTKRLLFNLVAEGYLFAIEWNTVSKAFGSVRWVNTYAPEQSGSSPTLSPNGSRVYIATGRDLGVPTINSEIWSFDTNTGVVKSKSMSLGGKVPSSLTVEYDAARGGNMIYAQVLNGPLFGFLEKNVGTGTEALECKWKTHPDIEMLGANAGKAGKFIYAPFKDEGLPISQRNNGQAGAFDTSTPTCSGTTCSSGCAAEPNWQISMGPLATDFCTRSLSYNSGTSKSQVYFGTTDKLISYEE